MSTEKREPKSNEILEVKMDAANKMDKFPVVVIKNKKIIGNLPLGKSGRLFKTIFYFLRC